MTSVSPRLQRAAVGRLEEVEKQLTQALCNFAAVEEKLRTEQELGKAFYLLKQEKAEVLRARVRQNQEGTTRTRLEHRLHSQEVELHATQQQLLAMRQRVVEVEAERDFIRAQAGDFAAYWKEIEAAWRAKEASMNEQQTRAELDLSRMELQLLDSREALETAMRETSQLRETLRVSSMAVEDRDAALNSARQAQSALQADLLERENEVQALCDANKTLERQIASLEDQSRKLVTANAQQQHDLTELRKQLEDSDKHVVLQTAKSVAALKETGTVRREVEEKRSEVKLLLERLEAKEERARESRQTEESLRSLVAKKTDEVTEALARHSECAEENTRLHSTVAERDRTIDNLKAERESLQVKLNEISTELEHSRRRAVQLNSDKDVLTRELTCCRRDSEATDGQNVTLSRQNDDLQEKLQAAHSVVGTLRGEMTAMRLAHDKAIDILEREVMSLKGELSRRSEDVRLLHEQLRNTKEARVAAEDVAHRLEEGLRVSQKQMSELENRHKEESVRMLDQFQRQCTAMSQLTAELPTVEESRRRAALAMQSFLNRKGTVLSPKRSAPQEDPLSAGRRAPGRRDQQFGNFVSSEDDEVDPGFSSHSSVTSGSFRDDRCPSPKKRAQVSVLAPSKPSQEKPYSVVVLSKR